MDPVSRRRFVELLALAAAARPLRALAADEAASPPGPAAPGSGEVRRSHALAMHGEPKYPAGFDHFDYVNPDAPKGGTVRLGAEGTYDSFNPYIDRGTPGVTGGGDTLLESSADEPFTEYGMIADRIDLPADRSWVAFHIHPKARWTDGRPIVPEDVVFSLETLKAKGQPFYRFYYRDAKQAEAVDERTVRFTFSQPNRELPLILGQLPILPSHWWKGRDFSKPGLEIQPSSGPYRIASFEAGRYVELERVPDYWAADLPVRKGVNNFDRMRYDYYRDPTVIRQALKAGDIDLHLENQAKAWALDYDTPAVRDGRLKKVAFPNERPAGMQAWVMNTRRKPFDDRRVRQALDLAYDFEWANRTLFFGQYVRTESFFANSDLASRGMPSPAELAILEPFRGQVPDEVFERPYEAPRTDGSGWPRGNLEAALKLLLGAGFEIRDMRLVDKASGRPFVFEILLASLAFVRIALPYVHNLRRLGIFPEVRLVDTSQYINRVRSFDFDMVVGSWGESESPGNEQRDFWGSAAAERRGSRNLIGIRDPAVDRLVELVIGAETREELVDRTRALDRVLLWHRFVVPQWHSGTDRYAFWDKFGMPKRIPRQGVSSSYWWIDKAKLAALAAGGRRQGQDKGHGSQGHGSQGQGGQGQGGQDKGG